MKRKWIGWGAAALWLFPGPSPTAEPVTRVDPARYRVETLVSGLDRPWSLAVLPDGRMLITELPGRLRLIEADGTLRPAPVEGVPTVYVGGQMGLMDVALDPDFISNAVIY